MKERDQHAHRRTRRAVWWRDGDARTDRGQITKLNSANQLKRIVADAIFSNGVLTSMKFRANGRRLSGVISNKLIFSKCWKSATFAVCLFFASSNAEAQRPYYFGRTADLTPVNVTLQDTDAVLHFRIPKAYLTFSQNWSGGLQEFLVIEASFPSMAPLALPEGDIKHTSALIIDLHSHSSTGAKYSTEKAINFFIKDRWILVQDVKDKAGRAYQYYVDKRDVNKRDDITQLLKESFVVDGQHIYFECLREFLNPSVGCSGFADYGSNLTLTFHFPRSQFERWPEFYEAAVRLLNSFREPG
jgi:hypothetical protein